MLVPSFDLKAFETTRSSVIRKPENFTLLFTLSSITSKSAVVAAALHRLHSQIQRLTLRGKSLISIFFYASIPGPRQVQSHKMMAGISVSTTLPLTVLVS